MNIFKLASDKGITSAKIKLGNIYLEGNSLIEKNESLAIKYFREAAMLGNSDGFYFMGRLYLLRERYNLAVKYFNEGAKKANEKCFWNLGLISIMLKYRPNVSKRNWSSNR
jgi:TPR repeat protein